MNLLPKDKNSQIHKTLNVSRSSPNKSPSYTSKPTKDSKLNYGERLIIKMLIKQFSHIPCSQANPQQTHKGR